MTRISVSLPVGIIVGVILASTLLLSGATTPTATAEPPEIDPDLFAEAYSYTDTEAEWTPPTPPRGVEITPTEYALMWTEQPDGDLSQEELITALNESNTRLNPYLFGVVDEFPSSEPSQIENNWNRNVTSRVSGGARSESIAPPNADREESGSIRDAHLTFIDATPHTILHQEGSESEYRVPRTDGELIFMFDYRIDEPAELLESRTDTTPQRRTRVYPLGSEDSNLIVTADGVEVVNRSITSGASRVSYTELPAGSTQLEAELSLESSYRVIEEVRYCDRFERIIHPVTGAILREYCAEREPWSEGDELANTTYDSEVILQDSQTVTVQNQSRPTGFSQEYNTDRGNYKLRLNAPDTYGSVKIDNRNWINGPYDFYLGHNQETETLSEYSSGGNHTIDTGFVTVEHHAYPPQSVSERPTGEIRGEQEADGLETVTNLDSTLSATAYEEVSLPETVNVDLPPERLLIGGQYEIRNPQHYFVRTFDTTPAEDGHLTLQTLIPGETREYNMTAVPTTQLQLKAQNDYYTGSRQVERDAATSLRVTFTLTDTESNRVNLNEFGEGRLIVQSPLEDMAVETNSDDPVSGTSRRYRGPVNTGEGEIVDAGSGTVTIEWDYPDAVGRFYVDFRPSVDWKQSGPYYSGETFRFSFSQPPEEVDSVLWDTVTTLVIPVFMGGAPVALMYGILHYAVTGRVPNPFN